MAETPKGPTAMAVTPKGPTAMAVTPKGPTVMALTQVALPLKGPLQQHNLRREGGQRGLVPH